MTHWPTWLALQDSAPPSGVKKIFTLDCHSSQAVSNFLVLKISGACQVKLIDVVFEYRPASSFEFSLVNSGDANSALMIHVQHVMCLTSRCLSLICFAAHHPGDLWTWLALTSQLVCIASTCKGFSRMLFVCHAMSVFDLLGMGSNHPWFAHVMFWAGMLCVCSVIIQHWMNWIWGEVSVWNLGLAMWRDVYHS